MEDLIQLQAYPVKDVLGKLLKDKTTKQNIIFATNAYTENDAAIDEKTQITEAILKGFGAAVIQPRVSKSLEEQAARTRKKLKYLLLPGYAIR